MHPLGPEVFALNVAYPIEDAQRVLAGWRDAVKDAPDELSTAGLIWSLPTRRAARAAARRALRRRRRHVGGRPRLWRGLHARPARARDPAARPQRRRSRTATSRRSLDPFFPAGARRYWKALYLDGFSDEAIETTVDWSNRRPSPETLVIVRHCGGAMARVGAEQTAFGDRSSEWMLSVDSTWQNADDDAANIDYTRAFWHAAVPFSDGKTYFNFPGLLEEGEAAVRASYGANHDRLARIKGVYDPDNRFRLNQNIRPAR